ncbi:hypothetical protein GXW82_15590 [Streptacidiphilus sp. 4-A2]|nr:hypothetical protein [Streptacidiphilus sp. 4-A2]
MTTTATAPAGPTRTSPATAPATTAKRPGDPYRPIPHRRAEDCCWWC